MNQPTEVDAGNEVDAADPPVIAPAAPTVVSPGEPSGVSDPLSVEPPGVFATTTDAIAAKEPEPSHPTTQPPTGNLPPFRHLMPLAFPRVNPPPWVINLACVLLMIALAFAATGRGWARGRVLAPTDVLRKLGPWRVGDPPAISPDMAAEIREAAGPIAWMQYVVGRVRRGEIPLWNPHVQLGEPVIGAGRVGMAAPTFFLHLLLPPAWAWLLAGILRLAVAGVGGYWLARRNGLSRPASILAGGVFMLGAPMVIGLNDPAANAIALLPVGMILLESLCVRVTRPRVVGFAAIVALQILAGDSAAAGLSVVVYGGMLLGRACGGRESAIATAQATPAVAAALALAAFLSAAQWIPSLEYATHARPLPTRVLWFAMPWGASLFRAGGWAPPLMGILPLMLMAWALATRWREPIVRTWGLVALAALAGLILIAAPAGGHAEGMGASWASTGSSMASPSSASPGSIAAWPSFVTPSGAWPFLMGLSAAWHNLFAGHLGIEITADLLAPALLGMAMLAGVGLDSAVAEFSAGRHFKALPTYLLYAAAGLAGAAIIGMIVVGIAWRLHRPDLLMAWGRFFVPALLLGAAWAIVSERLPRMKPANGWPWVALALLELLTFAIAWRPASGTKFYALDARLAAGGPAAKALDALRSDPPSRLIAAGDALPPVTASLSDVDDIRGGAMLTRLLDSPASGKATSDIPRASSSGASAVGADDGSDPLADFAPPEWFAGGGGLTPGSPASRLLNVRYALVRPGAAPPAGFTAVAGAQVINAFEDAGALPRLWVAPKIRVFENRRELLKKMSAPWDFDPRKLVFIDRDILDNYDATPPQDWRDMQAITDDTSAVQIGVNRQSDEAFDVIIPESQAGWLVMSSRYYPGWSAMIDDRHEVIYPAFGALQAVPIAPGNVTVHFEYQSAAWRWGYFCSIAGVAAALILLGLEIMPDGGSPDESDLQPAPQNAEPTNATNATEADPADSNTSSHGNQNGTTGPER